MGHITTRQKTKALIINGKLRGKRNKGILIEK